MMQVGDVVKWTGSDAEGEFTYKGNVTDLNDTKVSLETDIGVMTVNLNDGVFQVIGRADANATAKVVKQPKAAKTRKTREAKDGSKRAAAIDIYKRMTAEGAERKAVIVEIMNTLGVTKSNATVYHYNCRNKWCA